MGRAPDSGALRHDFLGFAYSHWAVLKPEEFRRVWKTAA